MQTFTTISVKIPKEEREEMRRLKIQPSKLVRAAIRKRLRAERIKKLKLMRSKMDVIFQKLSTEEVTASIREDRDSR